ncbi:MAG: MauE/DoxX family redox-associated membrane protein [Dermatophilaceae bacterium]
MIDALVAAPLLLAVVLLLAAQAKWSNRPSLVSATQLLRLPRALEGPVQWLPPIEAVLGVALFVLPWAPAFTVVAALTLGLMLAYTAVVARGLTFSPRPSCGCFGTIGAPITIDTLVRNVVLSALALAAVVWGARGHTVPGTLLPGSRATWTWLGALAVTAAITRWIVGERRPRVPAYGAHGQPAPAATETADPDDYVRETIPPLMFLDGNQPVTMRGLALERAQLLVFITCGCGRSHEAIALARNWRERMPAIDVRAIASVPMDFDLRGFDWPHGWLRDPDAQAWSSLGVAGDPVALLVGADGMLAGGPVAGVAELTEFGEEIAAALADAPAPEPEPASAVVRGELA